MCAALRSSCSNFINNFVLKRQPVDKPWLVLDLSPNLSHTEPLWKASTGLFNKTTVLEQLGARQGFFRGCGELPPVKNDFGASTCVKSGSLLTRLSGQAGAKRGLSPVFGRPGWSERVRCRPVQADRTEKQRSWGCLKGCKRPFSARRSLSHRHPRSRTKRVVLSRRDVPDFFFVFNIFK